MSQQLIQEVAKAVVDDAILTNWSLWIVQIALTFISAAIGAFAASFYKKRGETAAMKQDLEEIIRQLKQTTAATTETRTAIERMDWLEREWRTTRRQKLEQLIMAIYDLETWLEAMQEKWLHGNAAVADPRAIEKVKLLSALYFPELKKQSNRALMAHASAYQFILEIGTPAGLAKLDGDTDSYRAALTAFTTGWHAQYQKVRDAVNELEDSASSLMQAIAENRGMESIGSEPLISRTKPGAAKN